MQPVDDLGGTAGVGRAWWWYKGKRDLIIDSVHAISASRVLNDPFSRTLTISERELCQSLIRIKSAINDVNEDSTSDGDD
jgi:hypothetical protein